MIEAGNEPGFSMYAVVEKVKASSATVSLAGNPVFAQSFSPFAQVMYRREVAGSMATRPGEGKVKGVGRR